MGKLAKPRGTFKPVARSFTNLWSKWSHHRRPPPPRPPSVYHSRAHESAIIQLIRRRVIFGAFFVITLLKNGPHDLKMVHVPKDTSSNSTQSVISAPKQKYEESYDNFHGMSAVTSDRASWESGGYVCVRHTYSCPLELYLETPGRSRPKNVLYRRVSTSATIFARN